MQKKRKRLNNAGFIIADFLFAIVLVIGCGILVFGLTFSLTTIEVVQYITWSAARTYSAGNTTETAARNAALSKFKNLATEFPLLTGVDSSQPWFSVDVPPQVGNLATGLKGADAQNAMSSSPEPRQPWIGVSTTITLKLFRSLQFPFLGKITTSPDAFAFPIRAFILRHPSQEECLKFFKADSRFSKGIKTLENNWNSKGFLADPGNQYRAIEDNGC